METLKLVQKPKKSKMLNEHGIMDNDDLIDLFPLPRYFQVHFQHVHENTHNLHSDLAQLKDYVVKIDEKLERLMTELSRLTEHAL